MSSEPAEGEVIDPVELGRTFYHLRVGGMSVDEICDRLGLSRNTGVKLYRRYLVEIGKMGDLEQRQDAIELEAARYDALQAAFWNQAMRGDEKAANVVLKAQSQRSKLLGLEDLPATESSIVRTILVTGTNQHEFLKALTEGQTGGAYPDNEVVEGSLEPPLEEAT